jgi:hypothetical protein
MKPLNNLVAGLLCACALWFGGSAIATNLPSDWQREQLFGVATSGLVKMSLPVQTLDSARPMLEDLRLYDDAGNEVPYMIWRPVPVPKAVQAAKSFQNRLNPTTTLITLETGLTQPVDRVSLESPAGNFLKAVRVESSMDGQRWQLLVQGQPIFSQPWGANHLQVSFPPVVAKWLRISVDDQRSPPVPFTGACIYAAAGEPAPEELMPVEITERDENPGETRLALNLGAANLSIAAVQVESPEPLFMRPITLAVPQMSEDAIREQIIGQGSVYRVAIAGQSASENLAMPLEKLLRSRELVLLIKNGDSPPLSISAVRVHRRPVYLVFLARQTGTYHLLSGNANCDAPHYDLAGLTMNLQSVTVAAITLPSPADNPDFHAPEVLPGLELTGAPLDVSGWKFRKPVTMSGGDAQQIELDPDVLARAQPGFADLRLLHGSNQVPYIIQRTSISRALTPAVTSTNDAKEPGLSRWIIKLPQGGLPITRLACAAQTPLFERSLSLYEKLTDERGDTYRRPLGGAAWSQTPDRPSKQFALALDGAPQSDTLYLETENGDNPPLKLEKFTGVYPVTRILFKAKPDDELFLYYGNSQVSPPSYDLSLVANQLLAADKKIASLGAGEQLKKSSWFENQVPGSGGVVFWGVLALVVVVLLVIITRLLPQSSPPAA